MRPLASISLFLPFELALRHKISSRRLDETPERNDALTPLSEHPRRTRMAKQTPAAILGLCSRSLCTSEKLPCFPQVPSCCRTSSCWCSVASPSSSWNCPLVSLPAWAAWEFGRSARCLRVSATPLIWGPPLMLTCGVTSRSCTLTTCVLSSVRGGLRYDGGVHLHWNLLQRGHLHRLLLLFYVHDKPTAVDLLQ